MMGKERTFLKACKMVENSFFTVFDKSHRVQHVPISQAAPFNWLNCETFFVTFTRCDNIELLLVRFGEKLKIVFSTF